jgi:hypothetical protein
MPTIIPPTPENRAAAYRTVRDEVRLRYAPELRKAGVLGQFRLWFQMEREIAQEMKKRSPSGALFSAHPTR